MDFALFFILVEEGVDFFEIGVSGEEVDTSSFFPIVEDFV
jgi:hypothetical protein